LIVEDERLVALQIQTILRDLGHEPIAVAGSGEAAIRLAEQHKPDLILADVSLQEPIPDGIEAITRIRAILDCAVVYLTAYGDVETTRRAASTKPDGYLIKPFDQERIKLAIEWGLKSWRKRKLGPSGPKRFARLRTAPEGA
jgi:CheY-like chemotaxis protein